MTDEKKMKIVFAPGCFDTFEGSQEELDDLINQIQSMADSGELFERSMMVEDLDEEDMEMIESLGDILDGAEIPNKRTLQ